MNTQERDLLLYDARQAADNAIRGDTATGTFYTLQSIAKSLLVIADVLAQNDEAKHGRRVMHGSAALEDDWKRTGSTAADLQMLGHEP